VNREFVFTAASWKYILTHAKSSTIVCGKIAEGRPSRMQKEPCAMIVANMICRSKNKKNKKREDSP
jgi:hypothetical protein